MARIGPVLILCATTCGPVAEPTATKAPAGTAGHDRSIVGAMSLDELRAEPLAFELDVPYAGTDNPKQRLDVYLPAGPKSSALPVIVFFHAGGWFQGDKADGARRLLPLVRTGEYAGVSVGYRLSGEATWPAQIHDGKAAIRWVRANADKHGLDADRICVWGRSAGAHLALMLGVSGGNPELEGEIGAHTDVSSGVTCVANFFGVTDILALIGQPGHIDRMSPDAPEAKLLGGPLRDNTVLAASASPITYVSVDDPPVLTVHGDADPIVPYDQAVRLDAALRKLGIPSYVVTVQGAGHGDFPQSAETRLALFFAKYLLGRHVVVSTAAIDVTYPAR
jgi:acetyl esterase/lipase